MGLYFSSLIVFDYFQLGIFSTRTRPITSLSMGWRWTFGNQWSSRPAMFCLVFVERPRPNFKGTIIWSYWQGGLYFYLFFFNSLLNSYFTNYRVIMERMSRSVITILIRHQHIHTWKPCTNTLNPIFLTQN